ncbi:MAG: glycerophosphodiester phosphodiesterase family protein, partial [Burkholderiaceae bacterium]
IDNNTCTATRIRPPVHALLENTLDSMAAAFELGADVVEFDIHPTSDGEFVVFHDWTVDCRTNGKGVTREQTLAYLRSLDIGYGYTHDGGKTFPVRGQAKPMPTWAEVMAAFPGKRFLVNVKSNSRAEGNLIVAYLERHGIDRSRLMFYGAENPMSVLREKLPKARTASKPRLRSCFLRYVALGWTGVTPDACRDSLILVPVNYQGALWGWPGEFVARMAAVNSEVFVIGPYVDKTEAAGSTAIDSAADLALLAPGYAGGVMTDRIDVIGPLLARKPPD